MENPYIDKMNQRGFTFIADIFGEWENVKDEILLPERKSGSGNGTVHVFLGQTGYNTFRDLYPDYYSQVEKTSDTETNAPSVKHYFIRENLISILGYTCEALWLQSKNEEIKNTINDVLAFLKDHPEEYIETESFFKWSVGGGKLRAYFKKFQSTGVFAMVVRKLLLQKSAYKISLFKNSENKCAALWLIGFDQLQNFSVHPNIDHLKPKELASTQNPTDISNEIKSFLNAIMTKPFLLLAGISGTGKSQIVRKLAQATDDIDVFDNEVDRWELHKPANFELVQVKPNWHNSYDLVGYKSNINGEHYEYTPFIEFVTKAWQNPDTPFFLCLDEMNLAPVEEYFAEYLSAIESRSIDASTGQYETDPIIKPFRKFGLKVASDMILHLTGEVYESDDIISELTLSPVAQRFLNKGLTLPKNLIVMGTVNMDDTTFSFSRKVLDRAMSIEMNEVDFEGCIKEKEDLQMPVLTSLNTALVNRAIKSLEVIEGSETLNTELAVHLTQKEAETITDYLTSLNADIFDGTPFKLGYRACNEALLYARACKELGRKNYLSVAIDEFTTMKILSRIEGDEQKLKTKQGEPLLEKIEGKIRSMVQNLDNSISLEKIDSMKRILERDKFVSFWG